MQNFTFRYTRRINWRLKRSDHLFQGRYKSVLVDADSYLLEPGIEEVLQVVKKMFDLQEDEISAPGKKRLQSKTLSITAWAVQ